MCANFSQSSFSGTPCCSAIETAQAKLSIRPLTVEPSLAMVMKSSPGSPSWIEADGDVAFVAADVELVRDGGALFRAAGDARRAAAR